MKTVTSSKSNESFTVISYIFHAKTKNPRRNPLPLDKLFDCVLRGEGQLRFYKPKGITRALDAVLYNQIISGRSAV